MAQQFCNYCGGNYEYRQGRWVCPFCGSYRPEEITNEDTTLLYTAFQNLRLAKFSEAEQEFDDIIAKFPKNPNGYWGRLLARYGIKYEEDFDGKKIPTCYATSIKSFISDKDYLKAMELACDEAREYYKTQADYIERVRKEWVEKAKKEKPYDIFISYKDSDLANGIDRTQDSIEAQDLYIYLTNKGYRVFFSRESLRDKAGEKYEPYIFSALSSAKVMLVYGSSPDYITSTWVKNEWMRYEKKIESGEKNPKSLLIAYNGFSPGDLPNVLASKQCFNANDRRFYSDLTDTVEKILSEEKKVAPPPPAPQKRKSPKIAVLLAIVSVILSGALIWNFVAQSNRGSSGTDSSSTENTTVVNTESTDSQLEDSTSAIPEDSSKREEVIPGESVEITTSITEDSSNFEETTAKPSVTQSTTKYEETTTEESFAETTQRAEETTEDESFVETTQYVEETTEEISSGNTSNVSYSLTLKANNGTADEYSISIQSGKSQNLPKNTFTYTGYSFVGWSTTEGGSVKYADEAKFTMGSYSQTLYAVWDVVNYSITYDTNGGSISGQKTSYNVNTKKFTLPTPTKSGYSFVGWSGTDVDGIIETVAINKGSVGDRSYTANWQANDYTLSLNFDGADASVSTINIKYDSTVEFPTPSRVGYAFAGWYYGNTQITNSDGEMLGAWNIASNCAVKAKWVANTNTAYTVNHYFEKADSNDYDLESETLYGTTLASVTPDVKPYSNFVSPDKQTVTISADGSLVVNYFYKRVTYKLTYMTNGGDAIATQTFKYEQTVNVSSPQRSGYTFVGWFANSELTIPFSSTATLSDNTTIYACWDANTDTKYKVEYYLENTDKNGYDILNSETKNLVGTTDELVSAEIKSFEHFTLNSTKSNPSGKIKGDGSLVLKVYYSRNVYTISSNAENTKAGTITSGGKIAYGNSVNLVASANPGYTFLGWYEGNTKVCDALTFTFNAEKDVTYTAKWSADDDTPYTVNFYKENMTPTGYNAVLFDSITIHGTTDTVVSYIANEVDGCTFNSDKSVLSGNVNGDGSLILNVYYTLDMYYRDGNYIYFGEYPQTLKADDVAISTTVDCRGYYLGSDGYYYAKIVANPIYSGYTFDSGKSIVDSDTYYFKVQPIKWRILTESDGNALILCDMVIDCHRYDDNKYIKSYENSEIREWLLQEFYNKTFTNLQKQIVQTIKQDEVFILSSGELKTHLNSQESRASWFVTDYARATGTELSSGTNYAYSWLTSSLVSDYNSRPYTVFANGNILDYHSTTNDAEGVVPAMWIKL